MHPRSQSSCDLSDHRSSHIAEPSSQTGGLGGPRAAGPGIVPGHLHLRAAHQGLQVRIADLSLQSTSQASLEFASSSRCLTAWYSACRTTTIPHVRPMTLCALLLSATDATVPPRLRGKYRAFAERHSAGVRCGITSTVTAVVSAVYEVHVSLLPTVCWCDHSRHE